MFKLREYKKCQHDQLCVLQEKLEFVQELQTVLMAGNISYAMTVVDRYSNISKLYANREERELIH